MFYADLHVHSKYSRATSKDADLEHFAIWAGKKGLSVVGTGDFTHPAWLAELKEKLVPAEPGLFRLKGDSPTRFILQVEISTIYKRGGKTRKVHHIIFAPGFEQADRLVEKLSRIGNIRSDGRPILGLDSRDLLEIMLECGEDCFLIPAHIWTPWFSVLGSKSGFDSIEECYGDLSQHIFALETGLSSDPPMNWRLSSLDRYRLVSNSDCHSPAKLAREACMFDTDMSYFAVRDALRTGKGYAGTIEFFPEEGKYHVDGHRKCGVRMLPEETRKNKGVCPVCGKPLTVGVLNRVEELADRPVGARPDSVAPFRSAVPLPEILAEILDVGPDTKKVQAAYEKIITEIGPELFVLEDAAIEVIELKGSSKLAEAIGRMREGTVTREPGYDGEYGRIKLLASNG
jgi:DNA helicase II / ATP-dependent DNA helicase PcrA